LTARLHRLNVEATVIRGSLAAVATCALVLLGASAAAAPAVSLTIKPGTIVYGQEIALRGKVPRPKAGQTVTVLARICGFTEAVPVRTLKTKRGGAFAFKVGPTLNTTYSVAWGKAKSRRVLVGVSPIVLLEKQTGGSYTIEVGAGGGATFEGKHAMLQRLVKKTWQTVASVELKLTSAPDALTSVSSGSVKASVPGGAQLRASFPAAQARPCYRPNTSSILRN
jgi:hypothetical protein